MLNGKYYIGQHTTINALDNYEGSGLYLNRAQKECGLSNFVKTILFDFENFIDMNDKEKELIQLSNCFPYDEMSYNLVVGGINRDLIQYIGKNNPMYGKNIKDFMSKEKYEKWLYKHKHQDKSVFRTEEYRRKMKKLFGGNKNSMYGHKCTEYMTESEISDWREKFKLRDFNGINNPMYRKNIKDYMSEQDYKNMLLKRSKSMAGVNKGKFNMIHKETGKVTTIDAKDYNLYISMGYERKSVNKDKVFMVNKKLNKRIMVSKDKIEEMKSVGFEIGWKLV